MNLDAYPSLEAFLAAPAATVADVAPATMLFTAGGTRRAAALAGISPESDAFPGWVRDQLFNSVGLLFRSGVQHIFMVAFAPTEFKEEGAHRALFDNWIDWVLAGPDSLSHYNRLGWRVRLLGVDSVRLLQPTAARLCAETPRQSPHTLWFAVVPKPAIRWQWLLQSAQAAQARTQEEAIRALYGEEIPPATLLLSFGKPFISPDILPPLLIGQLQCYWRQRPGYSLTEKEWRAILYDYAFLRATWRQDKGGRAAKAVAQRTAWEKGPTLGLGRRLGPFWYPAATPEGDEK